jgi:hypothetical protein
MPCRTNTGLERSNRHRPDACCEGRAPREGRMCNQLPLSSPLDVSGKYVFVVRGQAAGVRKKAGDRLAQKIVEVMQ